VNDMVIAEKSIQELAYQLWQERGCPEGSSEQDWLSAEKRLHATDSRNVDESSKDSFPASDPRANHLPDIPAVNANSKREHMREPRRR